jgi:predicted CoA-binding protein
MNMERNLSTLVLGASPNPERYSHRAVEMLRGDGYPVHAFGLRKGTIADVTIETGDWTGLQVDTVTLYVGPARQEGLLEGLRALGPRRVIFNPGTENPNLEKALKSEGLEVIQACTLVLLRSGAY